MKALFALALGLAATSTAFAYDFSTADSFYAQRENGVSKMNMARMEYKKALAAGVQGAEKIYAVEQIGRLAYYESLVVSNKEQIKETSMACYETTSAIASTNSPQYFYWRAACLSMWAKANGPLSSLHKAPEILDLLKKGTATDATYEGGGFYRVSAAVYSKLPVIAGGDVDKAAELITKAIASPAFAGAQDPDTATGDYYYNAYEFQAEILDQQGKKSEAIEVLKAAIARIDSGDLPVGREPETRKNREVLANLLADLSR